MCGTPLLRGTSAAADGAVVTPIFAGDGAIVELGVVGADDAGDAGDSIAADIGVTLGGER